MELHEIPKPGDYNKMSNESRRAYDFIKASQMGLSQQMAQDCKTFSANAIFDTKSSQTCRFCHFFLQKPNTLFNNIGLNH